MSEQIKLRTFPATLTEALAMLYVQQQDLSKLSPSEIQALYWSTYNEIKEDYHKNERTYEPSRTVKF